MSCVPGYAGFLNYDLSQLPDIQDLLMAHQTAQASALQRTQIALPAVKVTTGDYAGLGNRIPGIVTGFVMALLAKRVFLLDSSIL